MTGLNRSHDPTRRSWVPAANHDGAEFPLQNLPLGVFELGGRARCGVAIGDQVLDLDAVGRLGLLDGLAASTKAALQLPALNTLMGLGPAVSAALRLALFDLLDAGASDTTAAQAAREHLLPQSAVRMRLPCEIGDFSDFLTSAHHTERHGRIKGLTEPMPPAFRHLPVAYHGRSSSIRVSGTPVRRPLGQLRQPDGRVVYGASESLDFELEMGLLVGAGTEPGRTVRLDAAAQHMFGLCLLNDWSAKRIQWWEQVLGPFLGKSFGTTISPWVVTMAALEPFRLPGPVRGPGDPEVLPYLSSPVNDLEGGLAIQLSARLSTAAMRATGLPPQTVSRTDLGTMYWSFAQMLTHHASNGCNLRPGDLMGSGTLSGPEPSSMACMTEITAAGSRPLSLPGGETRGWLHDGDVVELRARAVRDGFVPIGFGPCDGEVLPAPTLDD